MTFYPPRITQSVVNMPMDGERDEQKETIPAKELEGGPADPEIYSNLLHCLNQDTLRKSDELASRFARVHLSKRK